MIFVLVVDIHLKDYFKSINNVFDKDISMGRRYVI